ncbi:hypothetical protein [Microbulbifer celer]|uniref:Tail fiber protein n=1 Tax=Microbulbifer celer TaxID=435905 RepID=A0ABW3U7K1_9GAMM|nr:hypothetical protein [Microbulbifer celer]UFN58591.1 hypothetical protein LPW13_05980 [Microbulbifer celer]
MTAVIFHEPVFATIVESGDQLYFYEVGTTTDLTVYLDAGLSTPAPQPIVADAAGRFPPIYIDSTGNPPKVVLDDANDVQRWTTNEYPIEDSAGLSQSVAQLQLDVEAVEGDLLTAESDIDQLQTDVSDHESRITALEGQEVDLGNIGLGAKITRGATQPAPSGDTTVVFTATDFDDADIVVSNEIVIPAGVTRVSITGGCKLTVNQEGSYQLRLLRDGSHPATYPADGNYVTDIGGSAPLAFNISSGEISVSEGQTFQLELVNGSGQSATIGGGAFMSATILR